MNNPNSAYARYLWLYQTKLGELIRKGLQKDDNHVDRYRLTDRGRAALDRAALHPELEDQPGGRAPDRPAQ